MHINVLDVKIGGIIKFAEDAKAGEVVDSKESCLMLQQVID